MNNPPSGWLVLICRSVAGFELPADNISSGNLECRCLLEKARTFFVVLNGQSSNLFRTESFWRQRELNPGSGYPHTCPHSGDRSHFQVVLCSRAFIVVL